MTTQKEDLLGRTRHVQLSVDVARWPDERLDGILEDAEDHRPLTAAEVREHLRLLKSQGFEVVPCAHCECDARGHCQGLPKEATGGR